jgi:hypothetical protein
MLNVILATATLLDPTQCEVIATSRDMGLAVSKARHQLMVNRCDINPSAYKLTLQEKVENGVTLYVATIKSTPLDK